MSTEMSPSSRLTWLRGIAIVSGGQQLPMLACASKSAMRAVEDRDIETADRQSEGIDDVPPAGLRLIVNDDHGMMPTVTIVNQGDETVALEAIRPSLVSTDHGTYDLDALLAGGTLTIEPGHPRVIRITDIGRNAGEAFRHGHTSVPCEDSDGLYERTCRFA